MKLKTLSLYYLIGYLTVGGLGLLTAPHTALGLLGASGEYSDLMVRTVGTFMIALASLIAQIQRHDLDVLVRTTVFVRLFFIAAFFSFYLSSRDPLFLTITLIVSVGVALTAVALYREGRNPLSLRGL